MRIGIAAVLVAAVAVLMVWFPMSRTTAMAFAFVAGAVVGGCVLAAIMRKRSE